MKKNEKKQGKMKKNVQKKSYKICISKNSYSWRKDMVKDLTPRQKEVMRKLACGLQNKQIAHTTKK